MRLEGDSTANVLIDVGDIYETRRGNTRLRLHSESPVDRVITNINPNTRGGKSVVVTEVKS